MKPSTWRSTRIALPILLLIAGGMLFTACASGSQGSQPPPPTPSSATVSGPTATPTLAPGQFENPVMARDFPDPDVLRVGDTYYAYATGTGPTNLQEARSKDLVTWEYLGPALPAQPGWAKPVAGVTWAPDVSTSADGKTFLMYYTTRDAASDKQCIGIATSDKPEGPFRATGAANDKPFICHPGEGGDIDPASFVDDDGSRYVLWKNDGNCCAMDTFIYIQKVSGDGLTLEGQPIKLIHNDQVWEGQVIEGPTLWKRGGKYYLFYSANAYNGDRYAVGYAVAGTVTGPYTKGDKPILATDYNLGAAFGPGGQDITIGPHGKTWIVYHSWAPDLSMRWMQIDELDWQGDVPVVKGPSRSPEPDP